MTAQIWARRGLAVVAGLLTALSFEPANLWFLAPFGVAGLTVAVSGVRRHRTAFGLGMLYGLTFLGPTLGWVSVITVWVALVLIVFLALWYALLGVWIAWVRRLPGWPVWAAGGWLLAEHVLSRWPFGGFGWARLGYTGVDSPLAGLFPWIAVAGVSFVIALLGQVIAWAAGLAIAHRRDLRSAIRPAVAVVTVMALAAGIGWAGGRWSQVGDVPTAVTVGMVQGNVDGVGIDALGRARTVTLNHLAETVTLMAKVRTGELPQPDFILWPENSTDIDPLLDARTHQIVETASQVAGVPILVGAVTDGPGDDERQTTALWWDVDGQVTARYAKRNLVPFGEWIPFRSQLLPLIPMLELTGRQSVPGSGPGVLAVDVPGVGPLRVGVMICFELAYDDTVRQAVLGGDGDDGADVLTVQSNNATYAGTGQIAQQYAITRARAMESRREILVATTNATSGYIGADGTVGFRTSEQTANSTVVELPERTNLTAAVRYGPYLEAAILIVAVGGGLGVALLRRRPKQARQPT